MQYSEALSFIQGLARFGSKPGLDRISALLEKIGNPQNKLKFVHVAGTNGKGSICTMLSNILADAGYKTGLFISPYVVDFRERIQFNNQMIARDALAQSVANLMPHWRQLADDGDAPTEFEFITAVAMDYFARMNCDIVVLEVGLGGRYDATNVIPAPICSVIAKIDFDHTEILGDTIPKIAAEKCGIIKPGSKIISYPGQYPDAERVIKESCDKCGNKLYIAESPEVLSLDFSGGEMRYKNLDVKVPLAGMHQLLNASTVIEAVFAMRECGFNVDDSAIISGIGKTVFASRLETLCKKPLVILDGAHNVSGASALADALKMLNGRKIHAIVGVMDDKDIGGMLKLVLPLCCSVTAVEPGNARSMHVGGLAKCAAKYCGKVYIAGALSAGVAQAAAHCKSDDVILIFGSLYLAGEIRDLVRNSFKRLSYP